jgi:RimJ/RimL family protein N-acetyltransferase
MCDALPFKETSKLIFGPLRREDMPTLLKWRNASPGAWRDATATTITRQYDWYDKVVSYTQWWRAVYLGGIFVAQAQLYPVDWENKSAEIGLIVDPEMQGCGLGKRIVNETLGYGFRYLGLNMIWGEAYLCTDAWKFWHRIAPPDNQRFLPQRKMWDGGFWDSLYFCWLSRDWEGK